MGGLTVTGGVNGLYAVEEKMIRHGRQLKLPLGLALVTGMEGRDGPWCPYYRPCPPSKAS